MRFVTCGACVGCAYDATAKATLDEMLAYVDRHYMPREVEINGARVYRVGDGDGIGGILDDPRGLARAVRTWSELRGEVVRRLFAVYPFYNMGCRNLVIVWPDAEAV